MSAPPSGYATPAAEGAPSLRPQDIMEAVNARLADRFNALDQAFEDRVEAAARTFEQQGQRNQQQFQELLSQAIAQLVGTAQSTEAPPPARPAPTTTAVPTTLRIKPTPPPTFDGKAKTEVGPWLFQVRRHLRLCGIGEEEYAVDYAANLLRDDASIWWESHLRANGEDSVTQWSDFDRLIRDQFEGQDSYRRARDQLANCNQQRSVSEYVAAFRRITLRIPDITDSEALDRFCRGLKPAVRRDVELQRPTSLGTAISLAITADQIGLRLGEGRNAARGMHTSPYGDRRGTRSHGDRSTGIITRSVFSLRTIRALPIAVPSEYCPTQQ